MDSHSLLTGLERAAQLRPDAIAIEGPGDTRLSYERLHSHVQALAAHLLAIGVRAGDRVAILGDKSIAMVTAIHGILRAGAAYVPLSSDWPAARVEHILRDTDARAVIADRAHAPMLSQVTHASIIWTTSEDGTDESLPRLPAHAAAAPPAIPEPTTTDLAYIIFTSGSTGVPKGVMHTHGSALAFVKWAADELKIHPHDRISSHAPFNFDISTFDIFVSTLAGATLVLPAPDVQSVPRRFLAWLEDARITTSYSVPGVWVAGLHHDGTRLHHPELRRIIYAGEPMAPKHVHLLQRALPRAEIYNFYGPTETNVCTAFQVPRLDPDALPASIPIGIAVSGDHAMVEDGELLIAGDSVMCGYWGREPLPPGHFYRTGDLVAWDDALGGYVFHGRRDGMRKIRGFRVELGEIEACLLRHPAAAEAIADVDESDPMHHSVVAFVVPANGVAGNAIALKKHCAEHLPPYMVPRIIWRTELPRTPTGKVDRMALKKQLTTDTRSS